MCGIIGFSGKNKQNYSVDKIKLLLYFNSIERKSTDSIGFYHNGLEEPVKSIFSAKTILKNEEIMNKLVPNELFIGHVRNGTHGTNQIHNAHPYKIQNIIGVHNGTIPQDNIKDLCTKAGITPISNRTDSYNLFRCIAEIAKPNILTKVKGSMAILFKDTLENDTLYVYRNTERELYYGFLEEGMYISSERDGLEIIGCNNITIFTPGQFYIIKNGIISSDFKLQSLVSETRKEYNGSFAGKWFLCSEDVEDVKLKKGNWYLIDALQKFGMGDTIVSLSSGKLSDGKPITPSKKINGISIKHFDLYQNYCNFSVDYSNRICRFTNDIYADDNSLELLAEAGDFCIVIDKNFNTSKIEVYCPVRDNKITGVVDSDIRICLPEEEEELQILLSTFEEVLNIDERVKGKIKFSPVNEVTINEKLITFNQALIKKLDEIKSGSSTVDDYKNKLATIQDEIEKINIDVKK